MIKGIKMKNFMGFPDTMCNLTKSNAAPNNLAVIFGDTGSGKTSIVQAIRLLTEIVKPDFDMSGLGRYCMWGATEPTEVAYIFNIDGKEWHYSIAFTKSGLVEEYMYGPINKVRGKLIDIRMENGPRTYRTIPQEYIGAFPNRTIVASYAANPEYVADGNMFGVRMRQFLEYVDDIVVVDPIIPILFGGYMSKEDQTTIRNLQRIERLLNVFIKGICSHIKNIEYEIEPTERGDMYRLRVDRLIGGKIVAGWADEESHGFQVAISMILPIIAVLSGGIAVCDNFGITLHTNIVEAIIDAFDVPENKGQFIATVSDTSVACALSRDNMYIIDSDYEEHKEVIWASEFKKVNTTLWRAYRNGLFGGVPSGPCCSLEDIRSTMIEEQE